MTVAAISEVLGGRKILRRSVERDSELTVLTREGLPVKVLGRLAEELGIDCRRLALVIGISERTLSRRLASGGRLTAQESDRTVRLARVVAMAIDTLSSAKKASLWLQSPNLVLEGQMPLDLLDTDTGVRSVETILGRIAYGIYS